MRVKLPSVKTMAWFHLALGWFGLVSIMVISVMLNFRCIYFSDMLAGLFWFSLASAGTGGLVLFFKRGNQNAGYHTIQNGIRQGSKSSVPGCQQESEDQLLGS